MMKRYNLLSLLFILVLAHTATAQHTLQITKVEVNDTTKQIDIYVKALGGNNADLFLPAEAGTGYNWVGLSTFIQGEGQAGQKEMEIRSLRKLASKQSVLKDTTLQHPRILFLLDLSGSMRGEKLAKAKNAIRDALQSDAMSRWVTEFAWFHDYPGKTKTVNAQSYEYDVAPVSVGEVGMGKDTDLHKALKEKVDEYTLHRGAKAIILLTDGVHDIRRNPRYKGSRALTPITEQEILSFIREKTQRDTLLQIFPVGIGSEPNEAFLKAVKDATANPHDAYWYDIKPDEISTTFQQIIRDISGPNFVIGAKPEEERFAPGKYTFKVTYAPKDNLGAASAGSDDFVAAIRGVEPGKSLESINVWLVAFIATILLGLLLSILAVYMPIKHRKQFEKKFIKYYHQIKVPNVTKRDPLTKRDFTDMDQVVVSEDGKRVLALTTWKYYKGGKENEAGDYADLFPADLRASQFFSQRGDFKRFNWLWFGALGGGIAWAVLAIFKAVDLTWYQTFLSSWADREDEQISTAIFGDTLLGIAMGIGIITTLSWVEERGQSQKFSIGRVLLRVMLGVIGAYLVFLVQSFLLMKYIPIWEYSPLVRSCVGWLLFGAVLGLTLSFASSITPATGVKGGLLAAFIAFVVYSILDLPVFHSFFDSQIVAAIGYMTFGGVLGYTLHTVVAMYEDYELRCLSPRDFAMWQSPISKWLKSPSIEYIVIGKNPKSTVYVKWPDTHVADFHARMSLIKGLPHISPDQGEVLVNDMRISGPTPLENGDRIKLGSQSVSVLQFLAKESKLPPGSGRNLSASPAPAPSSGGGKGRSPQEAAQIRKQIQIKRK